METDRIVAREALEWLTLSEALDTLTREALETLSYLETHSTCTFKVDIETLTL